MNEDIKLLYHLVPRPLFFPACDGWSSCTILFRMSETRKVHLPHIGRVETIAEEEELLYSSSNVSLDQEGGVSYRFPPGVDLGTSYGSYLFSRRSNRHTPSHKIGSNVPHLPAIKNCIDDITLHTLYTSLYHLLESVNHLHTHLHRRGIDSSSLHNTYITLTPAINELRGVVHKLRGTVDTSTLMDTIKLLMIYVSLIIESIQETCPKLLHQTSTNEMKTLQRLCHATNAGMYDII